MPSAGSFVVLFVVGSILIFSGGPTGDDSPAEFASYFGDSGHRDRINIGWILAGLGLFFFIWFAAALRESVRETERREPHGGGFLSTVVLGGGAIYAAVAMAATGLAAAVRTMSDDTYHDQVYSGVIHAADDASYVMHATGTAGLAALIFAFSIAALGSRSLPRWLGWFGVLAGVAALASIVFLTMIIWLLWIAVTSLVLFARFRSAEPTAQSAAV